MAPTPESDAVHLAAGESVRMLDACGIYGHFNTLECELVRKKGQSEWRRTARGLPTPVGTVRSCVCNLHTWLLHRKHPTRHMKCSYEGQRAMLRCVVLEQVLTGPVENHR